MVFAGDDIKKLWPFIILCLPGRHQKMVAYFVCVVSMSISKSAAEPVQEISVHLLASGVLGSYPRASVPRHGYTAGTIWYV
jgi:hypothetical protein